MLIEKKDWVVKLRNAAGFKNWRDYCSAVGLKYDSFIVFLNRGKFPEKVVEQMSKYHNMDLYFLVDEDRRCIWKQKKK